MLTSKGLLVAVVALAVYMPAPAAERLSFQPIDAEPLGRVSPGAIVLHDGWAMQAESAAGNDGARFSEPGF